MDIRDKEGLYLKAKKEYYKGTPIMSDFEFDQLEEVLKDVCSNVVNIVDGDDSIGTRYPHMNPMLSLEKVQVLDEDEYPITDLQKFFNKTPADIISIECSPKLDGSAMSLKYVDGVLVQALTRGGGDKKGGLDKLDKLKKIVPNTITLKGIIEIRGEIVIDTKIFAKKYSHEYKNERNFVAGIMNKDEEWENIIEDFEFVAYHLVENAKENPTHNKLTMETLIKNGFNKYHSPLIINCSSSKEFFEKVYLKFKDYRENRSPYRLDGIVLKMESNYRKKMGENSHHPKWAIAIKFPPDEKITIINNIIWQLGPSGAMTPVADLTPIDLDGTIVKRASLHNLGKIEENKCWPGATVIIMKKGDIIPQIVSVLKESSVQSEIPTHCPVCKEELSISESKNVKQLYCGNEECEGKSVMKLAQGIKILGIERIGEATARELYKAGIRKLDDLFKPEKFNEFELIYSGFFKKGRSLDIIIEEVNKIKEIKIDSIINSLKFIDAGSTISREVGKFMSNVPYNFKGLNKSVTSKLINESTKENRIINRLIENIEKSGRNVIYFKEEIVNKDIELLEMTGSPKPFFEKKQDFLDFASSKNYKHSKLNSECKYLLTDNYSSTSSKMKKASKLGVEIITYEDFQIKYK